MPEEIMRHQVPESDPIYQDEREKQKTSFRKLIFGESEVSIYERKIAELEQSLHQKITLQEKLAKTTDEEERAEINELIDEYDQLAQKDHEMHDLYLRSSFQELAKDLLILSRKSEDAFRQEFAREQIIAMLTIPTITAFFAKDMTGQALSEFSLEQLALLMTEKLPSELLYKAALQHLENIKIQKEYLAEFVIKTKEEFKEVVRREVEKQILPLTAESALIRLDSTDVQLWDNLTNLNSLTVGTHSSTGQIRISNLQLLPDLLPVLRHSLFHEFLHELSGKSTTIRSITDGPGQPIHTIESRKAGLVLRDKENLHNPNTWLNEAITEWLALQLSGVEGETLGGNSYKGSYIAEREALEKLMKSGLNSYLVVNAYFENFSSEIPQEEKGKYFTALIQKIEELEGPGGFSRLENNFILDSSAEFLSNAYAYPGNASSFDHDILQSTGKLFTIKITVGRSELTKVERDFLLVAQTINTETGTITPEEQWNKVQEILHYLELRFGKKITYTMEEETIDIPQNNA